MKRFAIRPAALTLLLTSVGAAQNPLISSLKGSVSVRNGDAAPRVAAALHAPLRAGDYLTTGPNSRADIEFDSSDTFRMGGNAEIRFMAAESGKYQMELIKGDITYHAPGPAAPVVAVDTPSVSVIPAEVGVYRIAVNRARESEIAVMEGQVEIFAASGSEWIGAGQKMMVRGSASDPEFKVVRAISKWRRAARVLLSSMQLGVSASASSSEEQSYSKERSAPKPASKTTPVAAGNGNAKGTPPARGSFGGGSSGGGSSGGGSSGGSSAANHSHAAAPSSSHATSNSSTHTASTQTASTSSSHTAAGSSDHSSSSNSSRSK